MGDKALEAKENKMSEEEIEAIGAGSGYDVGFASNETEELMPLPISLAHKLTKHSQRLEKMELLYLRPDGKSQVTVEYDENDKPVRIEAVVLSTQHDPDVTQEQIHEDIKKYVFEPVLPSEMLDDETKYFINPTGRFVIVDHTETADLQEERLSLTHTEDMLSRRWCILWKGLYKVIVHSLCSKICCKEHCCGRNC